MTAFDDKMRKREQKQEDKRKKAEAEFRKQRITLVEYCLPKVLEWEITQEDHYSWVKAGGLETAAWPLRESTLSDSGGGDSVYLFQNGKIGFVNDREMSKLPYMLQRYVSVSDLADSQLRDAIEEIINCLSLSLFPDRGKWHWAFVQSNGSFAERQKLLDSLP